MRPKKYTCDYCGDGFESSSLRGATFCSDNCRYSYHNDMRRVGRLEFSIISKIDELKEMSRRRGDLSKKALMSIDSVISVVADLPDFKYKCSECGQFAFSKPEQCEYCESVNSYRPILLDAD